MVNTTNLSRMAVISSSGRSSSAAPFFSIIFETVSILCWCSKTTIIDKHSTQ